MMLARHAENLFWAGRYLERAESTARLVDVTYHALLEADPTTAGAAWAELLESLHLSASFADRDGASAQAPEPTQVMAFLIDERENPGSVKASVTLARDNLRGVRELISIETWEAINSLYLHLKHRDVLGDLLERPYDLLADVKRGVRLVFGVADDTMVHDDGWRFFALGHQLERVEMTCRLLAVRLAGLDDPGSTIGYHEGLTILKSLSASEAFRRTHRQINPSSVIEFMLLRADFPRSVLHSLIAADDHLANLGEGLPDQGRARRLLGRLRASVEFRNADDLLDIGLEEILDEIADAVRAIADGVADDFFRNAQTGIIHSVAAS